MSVNIIRSIISSAVTLFCFHFLLMATAAHCGGRYDSTCGGHKPCSDDPVVPSQREGPGEGVAAVNHLRRGEAAHLEMLVQGNLEMTQTPTYFLGFFFCCCLGRGIALFPHSSHDL